MRKRERKALGNYLRTIADLMELRDWHLDLSHGLPDADDAIATCEPIFGRKKAVFRFCDGFENLPREEQRNTVVHELVHCHLAAAQGVAERDMEGVLAAESDRVFFRAFRRNLEYAVDGLANAIAKHMPYPEWPER